MANNNSTITIPKWIGEISSTPTRYVRDVFRTLIFEKMKEYEREMQPFQEKYKISFEKFEQKVKSQKKEDFEIWDDYLLWKGFHLAHQKWLKRYEKI